MYSIYIQHRIFPQLSRGLEFRDRIPSLKMFNIFQKFSLSIFILVIFIINISHAEGPNDSLWVIFWLKIDKINIFFIL